MSVFHMDFGTCMGMETDEKREAHNILCSTFTLEIFALPFLIHVEFNLSLPKTMWKIAMIHVVFGPWVRKLMKIKKLSTEYLMWYIHKSYFNL